MKVIPLQVLARLGKYGIQRSKAMTWGFPSMGLPFWDADSNHGNSLEGTLVQILKNGQ